ncbi:MAG: HAD family phosphatase [Pseudomonadota bacterium]
MDGLLLDTERVTMDAFVACCAPLGIEAERAGAVFLTMVGGSGAQTLGTLQAFLPPGSDVVAFELGWSAAVREALVDGVPVRPTVPETLNDLSARGCEMVVVTSTRTARAEEWLERAGLRDHFATVIGGDAVSANKPDPAPYIAGADAIGRSPDACYAFEDSDKGVTSATAAGCRTWQIPDLRPPDQAYPELGQSIAHTLREAIKDSGVCD